MNHRKGYALAMAASALLGYGLAAAQFDALDPVQAAPHIYENVLENERVRVLKVTERNGETMPPEWQIWGWIGCGWLNSPGA